ncbi:MAG: nucleoside-triphosphatase [Sphaerochaeta sp.]|uniref:nucleoside-triphosphatase n=1 Tax=Sphaerochaeta sp. TaxID=1972642 RepID=UPI002FCB01F6
MQAECLLVVGDRDQGKTTTLKSLLASDRFRMQRTCGVLALANSEKTWYRLLDLSSGQQRLAMSMQPFGGATTTFGRFHLDESAFLWMNDRIISHLDVCTLAVFDEIGKLEWEGRGLAPAFAKALEKNQLTILAAVRTQFVDAIIDRFSLDVSKLERIGVEQRGNAL